MKRNVGSIDRIIRIVIGLGIAVTGMIFESYWGLIGIAIMVTGIFGFCGLYQLLKINTNKNEA